MGFDLSVSWKIDGDKAPWIYQNVSEQDGTDDARYLWIEENIIRAKTKSAFALTVSKYSPVECYSSKRQEIQDAVCQLLKKELATYHIILNQVDIREVFYNEAYEKTINATKLAQQESKRLAEVTKQKQELNLQATIAAEITIKEATAEAKALQIKGNSISSNPKIIQLEWIAAWKSGGAKVPTVISGDKGSMFMMNLDGLK